MTATTTLCASGDTPEVQLMEVARIYNTTATMGYPAIDEVTRRLGISRRTAQRRIHDAHERGLIPTLQQRKPSRNVLAIAEALDVTPVELAEAVQKIAGGTLRITSQSLTGRSVTP
ncbi:hypothetical protein [Nesterenkonia flava]|uniref:Uncharacterized protein n=1 Tax=Nesterenkonia flava TaxID=469799 RepID=A0ABU1FXQ6_9MICC|nr:hypothetical protein [Nesterenkonia flava]MDR5712938.1 hypothetical protein [Nesterenkonia flava]